MKYYQFICKSLTDYQNKKFIILIPLQVRKEVTTNKNAKRAKLLAFFQANWLYFSSGCK
jgi:hypothetical protein